MEKTIHIWNEWHLGDQIFTCFFFYHIYSFLEQQNIHIVYHIRDSYINQVKEFIPSKNITLESLDTKQGLNVWIGNPMFPMSAYPYINSTSTPFLDFLVVQFFKQVSSVLNIPLEMNRFSYSDSDLVERYNRFTDFKDVDIVIVNSDPMSQQVNMSSEFIETMNACIYDLNKKYKIVTTKKLGNIKCTLDANMTIKDIASISTHAKVVIAINTGPVVGMFNDITLQNIKRIYYADRQFWFSNEKCKKIGLFSDIYQDLHLFL